MSSSWLAALGLAAPWSCAGCGRPDQPWCRDCAASLTGPPVQHQPIPTPPGLPPIHVAAPYAGPVRAAIVAWKDRGRRDLARPLATALAGVLCHVRGDCEGVPGPHGHGGQHRQAWSVVPIPSSPSALRERGEDVLLRVARRATSGLPGVPLAVLPALRVQRQTQDQSGLSAAERRSNMDHALICTAVPHHPVILVDDVVTTGATLAEASRALAEVGVNVLGAATIAGTLRQRQSDSGR